MRINFFKNQSNHSLELQKESPDKTPDFLTMLVLVVLGIAWFYFTNGFIKFISIIFIGYNIIRYFIILGMDSPKTSFDTTNLEFVTGRVIFPLEDAQKLEISRHSEYFWKLEKPDFSKAKDKSRNSADSELIFAIFELTFEFILFWCRRLLFLIKKPAVYYAISMVFPDGFKSGFAYSRSYSEPELAQLTQALTEWTNLPVDVNNEMKNYTFSEFMSSI